MNARTILNALATPPVYGCVSCGAVDSETRAGHPMCVRHKLPPEGASDAEWRVWMMDAAEADS